MRSVSGDAVFSAELYLPREIWMVILGTLLQSMWPSVSMGREGMLRRSMRPSAFFGLSLVNRTWLSMVYESVTVIGPYLSQYLTDDILKRFVSLQELQPGGQSRYRITNGGVRSATNLTSLDLSRCEHINADGISELTKLTSLFVSSRTIDNGMKNLTNLRTLCLENYSNVSDDTMAKLTNLTRLDSWNAAITSDGLKALTNLTRLTLNYSRCNYDDAVKQLKNLTWLRVWTCEDSVAGVRDDCLRGLTNLTYLEISSDRFISDFGIETLTNLRTLDIHRTWRGVTDNGLRNLLNLTSLNLDLNFAISDSGISHLTNLSRLDIGCTDRVSDHGIKKLVNLTSLVASSNMSDDGISMLTNLTELDSENNKILTNAGIVGLTKLKSISLGSNANIGDAGIKGLTNLTRLALGDSRDAVSYECVKGLTQLVELDDLRYLDLGSRLELFENDMKGEIDKLFEEMPRLCRVTYDACLLNSIELLHW